MSYTIRPYGCPVPDLREAAAGYGYCLAIVERNIIVFADTPGELLEAVIPGYCAVDFTDAGDREALICRYEYAVQAANELQAHISGKYAKCADVLSDAEHSVLTADRAYPIELGFEWSTVPPLVLISTDYEPYTDLPRPRGDIAYINPHTDESLLLSLDRLYWWDYAIAKAPGM